MKEHDSLEKFIINNRDHFEELTPSPNSWEKISSQLNQNVDEVRSPGAWWVLRRAAAAVVIVLAMYGAYSVVIKFAQNQTVARTNQIADPVLKEYAETEAFYVSRVENKVAELERISLEHPQVILEVKSEFELLDSEMKTLRNDLGDGISRQEVIEAMVQNYRIKLKIVENILEQINRSNNENNKKDEEQTIHI